MTRALWIGAAGALAGGSLAWLTRHRAMASAEHGIADVMDPRRAAVALCRAYLPAETGDDRFAEIALDYTGGGTTCGYLPSWVLMRLGCTDGRIVNRSDVAGYAAGGNIAKMVGGAKALGAWRTLADGLPEPGDLCYWIEEPSPDANGIYHEHVNVALDPPGDEFRTADCGRTVHGHQAGELVSRKWNGRACLYFGGRWRPLVGWVSLTSVPLGQPPYDLSVRAPTGRGWYGAVRRA